MMQVATAELRLCRCKPVEVGWWLIERGERIERCDRGFYEYTQDGMATYITAHIVKGPFPRPRLQWDKWRASISYTGLGKDGNVWRDLKVVSCKMISDLNTHTRYMAVVLKSEPAPLPMPDHAYCRCVGDGERFGGPGSDKTEPAPLAEDSA